MSGEAYGNIARGHSAGDAYCQKKLFKSERTAGIYFIDIARGW